MITKKQLGAFDAIEVFSERYIKVRRGEKFNLIGPDGRYISDEWFDSVEHRCGGVDIVLDGQKRKCQSVESIGKIVNLGRVISNSSVLSALDIDHVMLIEARVIHSEGEAVTIIAQVDLYGESLLLSDDGRLFTEDGRPYTMPVFSISHTDICRIDKAAKSLCRMLNSEYRADECYQDTKSTNILPAWVFGFGTQEKTFNSARIDLIHRNESRPWGNDTIKLRFDQSQIKAIDADKLDGWMKNNNFKKSREKFRGKERIWYTKQFAPNRLDDLVGDIERIKTDFALCA